MRIKVYNNYHETTEIIEAKSIDEARKNIEGGLEVTAANLAENEVESDWVNYYETYNEALEATYNSILEQLISEIFYTELN